MPDNPASDITVANQPSPTVQPASAPTPPAPSTPSLIDQYELGDTGHGEPAPSAPPSVPAQPAAPTSAPPVLPPRHQHSRRLARMALDLGVPQEEIDATPSEQLDEVVYHLNRQAMALAREHAATAAIDRSPPPSRPAPGGAAAPGSPPEEDSFDFGVDEAGQRRKESDYDPGLVAVLKAQAKRIKELEGVVGNISQFISQRHQETMANRIDRVFARHEALFGRGRVADVQGTPEHHRRMAVVSVADRIQDGTVEEKIQRAIEIVFGAQQAAAPPAAPQLSTPGQSTPGQSTPVLPPRAANGQFTRPTPEQWSQAGLAQPTHREPTEPPGEGKAVKTAARLMTEMGLGDADEMADDGFL